jgi:acetyl-CoA carboxylase biotin carboxylase subunit
VQWQFRIAAGDRLTVPRADATTARGHAIECRVYAEDPDRGFLPSPGTVVAMRTPGGPGVRHDSGVLPGFEIPIFYDSMIAKLVVWAPTRHDAIRRLAAALDEYRIVGVTTTLPFFRWLVAEPAFLEGHFDTAYLDRVLAERRGDPFVQLTETERADAAVAAAIAAYLARQVTPLPDVVPPSGASAWRRAARIDGLR